jgi:nitrogen regulatory protein PII
MPECVIRDVLRHFGALQSRLAVIPPQRPWPIPKIKIDLVLPDSMVDNAVAAKVRTASTGVIGDGKIFLSKIDQVIRIRNHQLGAAAL